jgi:phthalate 4,5-dioxygenase oxygenase subunit
VHDQWAVESMGPVQDRTVERLGVSDRAVSANRRLLLRSIEAFASGAATPAHPISEAEAAKMTGPIAMDTIAANDAWQTRWLEREAERRAASPWAGPLTSNAETVGA